ncbi:sialidase family protein [Sediminibacterium sp.]|uniref:sialidase family protein n=1 Tax=Sediminibacterium sp. TaxID=1917865 RepID=UPI0027228D16|nr:sialidase family protein [Sediminibacterium sp.]MDO8997190.1 exo-alpha-sialidase [Sediminibacterium sp.]MDP1972777.1 exo-alpha-sialidase [Sediminibacterium sp.]MDP2420189.1 exo-alpha-sialidase [Sediminibacterium sp.]
MKKNILYSLLLMLMIPAVGCAKKSTTPVAGEIKASAYSPDIPVLKGLLTNAIMRVNIFIPADNATQEFSGINCSINANAISDIENITAYQTSAEPFSTNIPLWNNKPASANFNVPLTLKLAPGLHFIWFSVTLKSDASIDQTMELRAAELLQKNGKTITITQPAGNYAKLKGSTVRKAGDDNVNTYRIPGIVTTNKGTLLSVYDIRYKNSADLPGNIDVGLSRSTDNGKTWEPMKVIMDMGAPHDNNGVGDPAILFDPITKKIWVAALWSKGNRSIAGSLPGISPDTTGQFVLVSSDDDGITWSAPYTITPQIKNPKWHLFFNGPGSGIAMKDGKLVFAAQYWNENKMPYSTIIYSSDHGANWVGNLNGPKSNTTESQVVETTAGTLMLNMRDNRGSYRSVATTTNLGTSWTEHSTSYNALQDPVCMGSLIKATVKVKGVLKEVLFFSNPNTTSGRYDITIKASLDLGQTWLPANQLLIDERNCYGYSSLTQIDAETIGILYEGTKDLYFVKVPVASIIK